MPSLTRRRKENTCIRIQPQANEPPQNSSQCVPERKKNYRDKYGRHIYCAWCKKGAFHHKHDAPTSYTNRRPAPPLLVCVRGEGCCVPERVDHSYCTRSMFEESYALRFSKGFLPCLCMRPGQDEEEESRDDRVHHRSPAILSHVAGAFLMSLSICNGLTCMAQASGSVLGSDVAQRQAV